MADFFYYISSHSDAFTGIPPISGTLQELLLLCNYLCTGFPGASVFPGEGQRSYRRYKYQGNPSRGMADFFHYTSSHQDAFTSVPPISTT